MYKMYICCVIFQIVGMIVWENVTTLVDVKLVRREHDYQTVIEVSKLDQLDVQPNCVNLCVYLVVSADQYKCKNIYAHIYDQVVPLIVMERTVKDCVWTGVGELMTDTVT